MIDHRLKPWLIEVNTLSSYRTDSPLDRRVKFDLINDTIRLLNLSVVRREKTKRLRAEQTQGRVLLGEEPQMTRQEKEELRLLNMAERDQYDSQNLGSFRQSFPNPADPKRQMKYDRFLEEAQAQWQTQLMIGKAKRPTHLNYARLTAINNRVNNHVSDYNSHEADDQGSMIKYPLLTHTEPQVNNFVEPLQEVPAV